MENSINLQTLTGYVEQAEELTQSARASSEKCRDYYDHKQWTDEERATLQRRKQPVVTRNRIKPKIDYLLGMERQGRTDPKAFPRTPKHDGAADAATDAIRYVCDNADFPVTRSNVFENMCVEGTGGADVYVKKKKRGGFEIRIKRFSWDRLVFDPYSRERDFSDAKYIGGMIWTDLEDALNDYPDGKDVLETTIRNHGQQAETFDDAPRFQWADDKRKRVRICQMHFVHQGQWHVCAFTKGGFLQEPQVSPYLDEDGEPTPSLILQSAFVDREGQRYGVVKQLLDLQDEINKRASKALHLVSVRQTYGVKGGVDDVQKFKRELAKPDGHLEFTHGEYGKDFGVLPTGDMAASQFNLLEEAKAEIDAIGSNAAMAGKDDSFKSGRAQMVRQQAGQVELGPLFDSLRMWNKRIYRAVWNRIRQFWTEEKWIRVTDDENNLQWVGLNKPVTYREMLTQQYGQIPPELAMDPRLDQVAQVENNVAELDVDIVLDEAPDTVTLQSEQFELLAQMFQSAPDKVPWEMVIEASTLRNKERLLEYNQGNAQAGQQMQQQKTQLEMAEKEAEIEKDKAQAAKYMAEAQQTGMENQLSRIQPQVLPEF